MTSINDEKISFKEFEENVFKFVCNLGRTIIKKCLEETDNELMVERDKEKYRHKGLKKTSLKTVMGTVEYERAIYKTIDENGTKKHIYLLDEYLDMKTIGKMSGMLIEKVLENVSIASFRKSASNVTSITGQSMSHGAVWELVKEFGKKIEKEENVNIEKFTKGQLKGEKEVDVLFMESDGLWLNMQRKDRPKNSRSGKREIKLGIHYEGWEKRNGNGKTYVVKSKGVVAGFTDPESFKLMRDTSIAQKYNYDEIKYKILNGDGASWIKNGHYAEGEFFQLDRFHIARVILRNISDKKEAKKLWKSFKMLDYKEFKEKLTALKYECGGVYEEVKKIEVLEHYLENNKDGLIPYHKKVKLPEPIEGMYYRNLGTMEHNVFDVLGYRMKGQKMSWSIKGANNLAKILAIKASGKLYQKINSLLSSNLSDKAVEIYETVIENTKHLKSNTKNKSSIYSIHECKTPFTGVALTQGRRSIRKIFQDKVATELIYR